MLCPIGRSDRRALRTLRDLYQIKVWQLRLKIPENLHPSDAGGGLIKRAAVPQRPNLPQYLSEWFNRIAPP